MGSGEIRFEDGARYIGDFKENMIHGKGKYTWKDGKSYEGDWMKIKCKARGKLYGLMEENIMENILMIKNRDMESLFGRMVGGMKGNGWKGNRMGKELRF